MVDLGEKQDCICKKYNSVLPECINDFIFQDSGKQIKLEPKNREKTILIAIDNCLITSNSRKKCDCLFIYKKENSTYSFLTELKGRNDIPKAFLQLSLTREYPEYKNIITFYKIPRNKQKFVIVSDIQLNKVDMRKLEHRYNIRVGQIIHSDPQSPIPDLKDKI